MSFPVSATVTGLAGTGLTLQNNGGSNLAVTANGTAVFTSPVASGATYNVTVLNNPVSPTQTCTVSGGSGTIANAPVTTTVACTTVTRTIGGTVTGLTGTGLQLTNNGGNALPIAANGAFTFTTPIASGVNLFRRGIRAAHGPDAGLPWSPTHRHRRQQQHYHRGG